MPLDCKLQGENPFFVYAKALAWYLAYRQYLFVKGKHHEGRDLIISISAVHLVPRTLPVYIVFSI